ncbi:cadmium-translocating P-type ATPase [Nakamurella flava]|uniref:Cadmium-translocating P-type ATPase n=1 Tax=Nakamurella flava TaxID=2576308 RepID=A0A4U6QBI5_9ACTN|nr:heavy metal translocating P-type ATPase [Nakamurella flava]TKV57330.1 cadmium-translocating P-type ATPase [Nakamurella flava]
MTCQAPAPPSSTTARDGGRVLAAPPPLWRTGWQLPEVRWAAAALALFLTAWGLQLTGAPAWSWWSLYLACYLAGGWEPAVAGWQALREKTLDVDLLMIVAAVAAASIGQVFDGALLVVVFATSGALEAVVTQRTATAVSSLLDLAPEQATRLGPDGEPDTITAADLQVGDIVLVRPGERIAADGTVVDGVSDVDQSAMTGESVSIRRDVGDPVLSGTLNGTGALRVRVGRAAAQSVVARVVAQVEQASATKARRQLFIEHVEQRYSFGVVVATLAVFGVPLLFGADPQGALLRAVTFMIVASPCAVVLSTMPPLLAAIANAGRHGLLVTSATVMERLGRTQVVAFDKTGTLTVGAPQVRLVEPFPGATADQVLRWAAAVEAPSEHPLGRAIVGAATDLDVPSVSGFRAVPGVGVLGTADGHRVEVSRDDDAHVERIGTAVLVRVDGRPVGRITLKDALRADAPAAVARIDALTVAPVHLLTGDNAATAADVADRTHITHIHPRLLPSDKAAIVADLEKTGTPVLVVGDGVNDAPALATASVGVAMGRHGSDLALDTADAVLIRDDLHAIPAVIALSRRAHRVVVANLALAASFIVVLVAWDLVATLPLPLAVAGHEGSTVLVALNGLRLLRHSAWSRADRGGLR